MQLTLWNAGFSSTSQQLMGAAAEQQEDDVVVLQAVGRAERIYLTLDLRKKNFMSVVVYSPYVLNVECKPSVPHTPVRTD